MKEEKFTIKRQCICVMIIVLNDEMDHAVHSAHIAHDVSVYVHILIDWRLVHLNVTSSARFWLYRFFFVGRRSPLPAVAAAAAAAFSE